MDTSTLEAKKAQLEQIRAELKTEFFGIDHCIDSIITSIQTWWLLPEIIVRPVIVNLWGLTGCGKTALVRSLVKKLGMGGHFVEIQMDAFSSNRNSSDSILTTLNESSVEEGKPGIILLDEFQRFRTIDDMGADIEVKRYADTWMLLSDGMFSNDCGMLKRMHEWMLREECQEQEDTEKGPKARKALEDHMNPQMPTPKNVRFKLWPGEAEDIKRMLRCPESLREIMMWDAKKIRVAVEERLATNENRPIDFTKCLVFIAGNLDEAFRMSGDVEDCDTSADVFYQHTRKIGVIEIKKALSQRFRPEQIARLGNNHIVYPSLSESAYMKLIRRTCLEYAEQSQKISGVSFQIDESVYQEIYANAVYPTQGTRPVFSSIHKMFGSPLSDAILWAIEHSFKSVAMTIDLAGSSLVFSSGESEKRIKIDLDIRKRRASRSKDFNALVAVHEAGHAVAYAASFKTCPLEVAVNIASFSGGYNLFKDSYPSKMEVIDQIAVGMGGIAAEELIFGERLRSTGCESDVSKATQLAARYVRRYAMGSISAYVLTSPEGLYRNDLDVTDGEIESLVQSGRERARMILEQQKPFLIELSKKLLNDGKMDAKQFEEFSRQYVPDIQALNDQDVSTGYAGLLEKA